MDLEKTLQIISRSWGRQTGFVFFPYIDREVQIRTGQRRAGYNEGPGKAEGRSEKDSRNQAFRWPKDREEILEYMAAHKDHDLYWCPSIFEYPHRLGHLAGDEHTLWADLDEVDPSTIVDYPPTVAWETSPGRYQALWRAASGDFMGASWPGNENQQLTYYLGADASGWDTTQLLRVPGWPNHKPEYQQPGQPPPRGKLLWSDGRTYQPGDFADLPEVKGTQSSELTDALEADIEGVDRLKIIAKVRLKLNHKARDLLSAREASGDVSGQLWYLMRCLADVGCSIAEIVAICRETVWNKFRDRSDEMRRLITEASKAISQRSEEKTEELEEEVDRPVPQRLAFLLRNIKPPNYVIDGILTEGACGFIAGEPKSSKSWVGLDMALSVSSGQDFLNHFQVRKPGPVLYIQEEDPATLLKDRSAKIWSGKVTDKLEVVHDSAIPEIMWLPPEVDKEFDPDVNAYVQHGVTLSDPSWQLWLDETLEEGLDGVPYRLVVIDTLMMTAGDVDENKSQEMTTKIFRPTKILSRKHNVAVQVVHHLGKATDKNRSGQRMLGSVANHAWGEDSLYLLHAGTGGGTDLKMEVESKHIPASSWRVGNLDNREWDPAIEPWSKEEKPVHTNNGNTPKPDGVVAAIDSFGTMPTANQLATVMAEDVNVVWNKLKKAQAEGTIKRLKNGRWQVA